MVPNSKWQLVKKLHLQKHWHKPVYVVIDLRHINKALICSYWDCKYISLTKPLIVCCLDLKKLCLIKSKTVKNGASGAPLSLPAQTFVNHYWLFDSRTVTQFVFIQTVLYFIIIFNWTVCPFYRLVQHQWQNSCFLGSILLELRNFFKRGVPLTVAIESKLAVLVLKSKEVSVYVGYKFNIPKSTQNFLSQLINNENIWMYILKIISNNFYKFQNKY